MFILNGIFFRVKVPFKCYLLTYLLIAVIKAHFMLFAICKQCCMWYVGLCAKEALRRWVPTEDGRDVWMYIIHC